jgi:hypothetical protein
MRLHTKLALALGVNTQLLVLGSACMRIANPAQAALSRAQLAVVRGGSCTQVKVHPCNAIIKFCHSQKCRKGLSGWECTDNLGVPLLGHTWENQDWGERLTGFSSGATECSLPLTKYCQASWQCVVSDCQATPDPNVKFCKDPSGVTTIYKTDPHQETWAFGSWCMYAMSTPHSPFAPSFALLNGFGFDAFRGWRH